MNERNEQDRAQTQAQALITALRDPTRADRLLFFLQHVSNATLDRCGPRWKGCEDYAHRRLCDSLRTDLERGDPNRSRFAAAGGFDLLARLESLGSIF